MRVRWSEVIPHVCRPTTTLSDRRRIVGNGQTHFRVGRRKQSESMWCWRNPRTKIPIAHPSLWKLSPADILRRAQPRMQVRFTASVWMARRRSARTRRRAVNRKGRIARRVSLIRKGSVERWLLGRRSSARPGNLEMHIGTFAMEGTWQAAAEQLPVWRRPVLRSSRCRLPIFPGQIAPDPQAPRGSERGAGQSDVSGGAAGSRAVSRRV